MSHLRFDGRDLVPYSGVLLRLNFNLLQVSQLLKQGLTALILLFERGARVPQVKHTFMDLALMGVRQVIGRLFSACIEDLIAGVG